MKHPFVSVIIPVWDHAEDLAACLNALENQTYQKDRYEVIVIDNGSPLDLKFCTDYPQARLTFEKKPGSYAARNKGISLSKGDVLAFTDADCIPARDWIEKGTKVLHSKPNQGFIGGIVQTFTKKRPTLAEQYEFYMRLDQKYFVEKQEFAMTANMFTFKHVMKKVGPFDGKMKSSGDLEWCNRVIKAGYLHAYSPETRVAHAARHTMSQLYSKERRIAGGLYDLRKRGLHFKKLTLQDKLNHIQSALLKSGNTFAPAILFITLFLRSIRLLETLRLNLGGKPKR